MEGLLPTGPTPSTLKLIQQTIIQITDYKGVCRTSTATPGLLLISHGNLITLVFFSF